MTRKAEISVRTAALRRQHDAALGLIGEISKRTKLESCKDEAFAITLLLARLTGLLRIHFAQENGTLYPFVMLSANDQAVAVAWRLHAELGDVGPRYEAYFQRWSSSATITASIDRFRHETSVMLAALEHRIERENEELFPLADALASGEIAKRA